MFKGVAVATNGKIHIPISKNRPVKILLTPDKFKGSLSAREVCDALAKGILQTRPPAEILTKPMADGGDGSLAVLEHYFELRTVEKQVRDPLGRPLDAHYKRSGNRAFVELAVASGLTLLQPDERKPLRTSSYGTGDLITDALQRGATEVLLFIGGSATNDGGTGIAHALGYRFRDAVGQPLEPTGENLAAIAEIDARARCFDPSKVRIRVICDVDNPLYGPQGAAHVYARQKGATAGQIEHLDAGLIQFSRRLIEHGYPDISKLPGAGAAGGIGGGAVALLNAELRSGIDTFLEITDLETAVQSCDLVITGEGRLDRQTERGKVVSGVCQLARRHDKPVIAVCGDVELPLSSELGIARVYSVLERSASLEEAMERAGERLVEIGREIGRVG